MWWTKAWQGRFPENMRDHRRLKSRYKMRRTRLGGSFAEGRGRCRCRESGDCTRRRAVGDEGRDLEDDERWDLRENRGRLGTRSGRGGPFLREGRQGR